MKWHWFKNKLYRYGADERGSIVSNDTRIIYRVYGDGMPMLMLHGNMQDASFFKKQIEHFCADYKVIAIDSRGHGESDFGLDRLTLGILSEDIVNLITELGLEHVIVLGFSDGGNIAIRLAQIIPQRLSAVVAVGSNLHPEGLKHWIRNPVQLAYGICRGLSGIRWFNRKAQLLSLMLHEPNMTRQDLEHIRVPVLIVAGQYDLIHHHHSKMIAKELPDSEFAVIKSSGHGLLKTHAKEANAVIRKYLEKVVF